MFFKFELMVIINDKMQLKEFHLEVINEVKSTPTNQNAFDVEFFK